MTNSGYQHLAKEFMDLWQKQISSVISDKQFIQTMLELFQTSQNPHDITRNTASAQPSAAHDADTGMLAEFAFRLAMCEKRLAALEGKPAKKSKGTTAKRSTPKASPRPRSKKPRN